MTSLTRPKDPDGNRREVAMAIAQDLRELVLILTNLFEYDLDDTDVLVHISNAKCAAERGLLLSERLANMSTARQQKPN
jgi:hypothetical protein